MTRLAVLPTLAGGLLGVAAILGTLLLLGLDQTDDIAHKRNALDQHLQRMQ